MNKKISIVMVILSISIFLMIITKYNLSFGSDLDNCPECGKMTYEGRITKAAKCLEDGEETWRCTACGKNETMTIPKLDHELTRVPEKKANCKTPGNIEYWKCSRCKKNFGDDKKYTTNEITTIEIPADPTAHTYIQNGIPARYEAEGDKHYQRCFVCNAAGEKSPHTWSEGYRADDNVHYKFCTTCLVHGKEEEHTCGENDWKVDVAATCTKKGKKSARCKVCERGMSKDISATGHSKTKVEAKEATCTEDGNKLYYKCQNNGCTACFESETDTTEYDKSHFTIKASHDFSTEFVDNGNGTHSAKCKRKGCNGTSEPESHTYKEKIVFQYPTNNNGRTHRLKCDKCDYISEAEKCTIDSNGVCSKCNGAKDDIKCEANNGKHRWGSWKLYDLYDYEKEEPKHYRICEDCNSKDYERCYDKDGDKKCDACGRSGISPTSSTTPKPSGGTNPPGTSSTPTPNNFKRGDVNCSGTVTITDLMILKKHIVKLVTLADQGLKNADVDENGTVGVNDLMILKKYIVNLPTSYTW